MSKHYHFKTLLCLMLVLVSMLTTVASAATLRGSPEQPYSLTSSGTIDEGLDRDKTDIAAADIYPDAGGFSDANGVGLKFTIKAPGPFSTHVVASSAPALRYNANHFTIGYKNAYACEGKRRLCMVSNTNGYYTASSGVWYP